MEPDFTPPAEAANADAARAQLKRLLAHQVFRGSRRCAHLLEYLVEYKLRGETVPPKERILGVEVFERETGYDTADDPVVRGAANEIRKRIAQYYLEPGHEHELRFDLPTRSYMPEFYVPEEIAKPPSVQDLPHVRRSIPRSLLIVSAVILALCVLGVIWMRRPGALDRFWSPVLDSSNRLLICVLSTSVSQTGNRGDAKAGMQPNLSPSLFDRGLGIPFVPLTDNSALVNIVRFLDAKRARFDVQYHTLNYNLTDDLIQPSLAELRKGPAIFVGHSDWTFRILPSLRFHAREDPAAGIVWIEDGQNPANKKWNLKLVQPFAESTQDYAIISRISHNTTGQTLVFVTGLGLHGTAAASEFLTTPSFMNEVASSSSPDWRKKNLQIVIHTEIAGKAWGSPQLLAKYFW